MEEEDRLGEHAQGFEAKGDGHTTNIQGGRGDMLLSNVCVCFTKYDKYQRQLNKRADVWSKEFFNMLKSLY